MRLSVGVVHIFFSIGKKDKRRLLSGENNESNVRRRSACSQQRLQVVWEESDS